MFFYIFFSYTFSYNIKLKVYLYKSQTFYTKYTYSICIEGINVNPRIQLLNYHQFIFNFLR